MPPSPEPPPRTVATLTVVGAGRLGRVLARALRAAGMHVNGPIARGEAVVAADAILLCVADDDIAGAAATAASAAPGALVGHTSGATPMAAVGVDFSIHPLQTFVGDEGPGVFEGIGCAVAGTSAASLALARQLAVMLGARPFTVADDSRAAYHAAASLASNFAVTLWDAAEQVAAAAGLSRSDARALLAPLVRSTMENWAAHGPEHALTGPIRRGDERTVSRQREAIAAGAPLLLPLFDALGERTRELAERSRAAA